MVPDKMSQLFYREQFMGYESSYDVYRTGKHCNIGRICTPMVYIPANTAELPCPLQVIQRLSHSHELLFLVFAAPCQKPCLQIFTRFVPDCVPQVSSRSFRHTQCLDSFIQSIPGILQRNYWL